MGTLKFPLEFTRHYWNYCAKCKGSYDGGLCPLCGQLLVMGSRDRLEVVADRSEPVGLEVVPPFQQQLPLALVLALLLSVGPDSKRVRRWHARLLEALGHERFILTEAGYEEIAQASTPQLARAIIEQRTSPPKLPLGKPTKPADDQLSLGF